MKTLLQLLSFLTLFLFSVAHAQQSIFSTAPNVPQSSMARPHGYERCYIVPEGYRRGAWETWYVRCHYRHHRVYETGHFRCVRQRHYHCYQWQWIPEHWVRYYY